ncbi:MAG: hypothetical protein HYV60_03135 [Planctomycetia bacterium]|nr:hypothetical protein [Planctomycetia bacterium]
MCAEAIAKTNDLEGAEAVLMEGLKSGKSEQLHDALARLYITEHDQLNRAKATGDTLPRRMELLRKALAYSPKNIDALSRLAMFAYQPGDEANTSRAILKQALARGEVPAAVHLALGTAAAAAKDWPAAKLHLEQANRLNQNAPVILNNLAWVLASQAPPESLRALDLVNTALQIAPGHPEILATRGQILMRLERWPDSLTDLEAALQKFQDRANLHESLAVVYTKLGDSELAEVHRELAAHPVKSFQDGK